MIQFKSEQFSTKALMQGVIISAILLSPCAWGVTTTITQVDPPDLVTNSTSITFEFTSDTPDAYFVCALDDADPLICTSPMTYSGLSDGQHKFQVFAVSPSEGHDYVGAIHLWRVDTIAPLTKISAVEIQPQVFEIDLQSNESNVTYVCSLDAGPIQPCSAPYILTGLSPGPHHIQSYAIDEARNQDPKGDGLTIQVVEILEPVTTRIVRTDPSVPFTNRTDIAIEFEGSGSINGFVCTLNGASQPCTSPFVAQGLPDQIYEFKVQAQDRQGNLDPVGANYSWTVDTVAPQSSEVTIDSTSTTITATWTTNEPATTEAHWGLDGDLSRQNPSDLQFLTTHTVRLTGLSSYSRYSLQLWGVDRAGNPYHLPVVTVRTKR